MDIGLLRNCYDGLAYAKAGSSRAAIWSCRAVAGWRAHRERGDAGAEGTIVGRAGGRGRLRRRGRLERGFGQAARAGRPQGP